MKVIKVEGVISYLYYFPSIKFLYIKLKSNVEFSLGNVIKEHQIINEIKKDETINLVIDIREAQYEHFPKESLQYLSDSPYSQFQLKKAILLNGLGQKLLGNFYLRFFKPKVRTRIFSDYESAFNWLEINGNEEILKEINSY